MLLNDIARCKGNDSQQCKTCMRRLAIAEDKKRAIATGTSGLVSYMAPPKIKDKCDRYIRG